MQEVYVESAVLVDLEDNIERTTRSILTAGGWFFGQMGTYTVGNPLSVLDNSKTKLNFNPSNMTYTDGRNLSINYDTTSNKFTPLNIGDCFIVNLRFKMKAASQAGHMDILLESPTVSFNPISARTVSFNKQAGDEQFQSITEMIFISNDVSANGLEVFVQPHGTTVQIYDISILVSKQYLEH